MKLSEEFKNQVRSFYTGQDEEQQKQFEIWPENWQAYLVFERCVTQWNYVANWIPSPQGGVVGVNVHTGLNYQSVMKIIEFDQLENPSEIFQQVQVLERGALLGFKQLRERSGGS